ncbi:hypothetical protein CL634_02145, partial [bacterium]|nr:hypothetical protein [bacterium]
MAINIKEVEKGLEKLYTKLVNAPEKGFIIYDFDEQKYIPSLDSFLESNKLIYENPEDLYVGTDWQQFLIDINLYYGYGPEVESSSESTSPPANNTSKYEKWYKQSRTFLSKDEKYYVVPILYKKMVNNPAIKPFFSVDAALEVPGGILKLYGPDGLLNNEPFTKSAKIWALQKLASDLGKATSVDHVDEAQKIAFLPADTITRKKVDDNWEISAQAESWHVDQRAAEYQDLSLKMMFDRGWVDSLPSKGTPCVDPSVVTRTVLLFIKTFEQDLKDLEKILKYFDEEIMSTDVPVAMSFNASTSAQKISKILPLLNKLLESNNKPTIDNKSTSALQFGFSEEMKLQYIAFSEVPECLCDQENINAYVLENGVDELKITPPFDSKTVNGFLFYLPDIMRKYSSYLKKGKNQYLFSTQESWLTFVKSYVTPEPEIIYNTSETLEAWKAKKWKAFSQITSSMASLTKQGLYLRDPTILMAPDIRDRLLGSVNAEVRFGGDDIMLKALTDDIYSTKELWNRLLNKVPIFELIKIAVAALVKCTGDNDLKRAICDGLQSMMPVEEIRSQLYPCLKAKGPEGEVAIAHLETKISGRLTDIYKQARAIYPKKFPLSGDIQSEATMAALSDLYCSDPQFAKALGRPPNDLSEEMLSDLDELSKETICECILTGYGPVQEIMGFIENTKDDVVDIVDLIQKNKAQGIEGTVTFPFYRIIKAFQTINSLDDFGDAVWKALIESTMAFIWASVLVLLNKVKESVLGGLAKDICNAFDEPWKLFDPTEAIMKSKLYEDQDFAKLKETIKKIGTMAGLSADVINLVSGLKEMGRAFTPSELRRLFLTDPGDNSADDVYIKAAQLFMPADSAWAPGTPSAMAIAATTGDFSVPDSCISPDDVQLGAAKDFIQEIGKLIDPIMFEHTENMWEQSKAAMLDLCSPEGLNVFAETLDPDAILKLAEKDQKDLIDDIVNALPLLDPQAMEDMMPPLFCGPCSPKKVGQKPLMPTQSHPTQLTMFEELNTQLFQMINREFDVDISTFKPVLFNDRGTLVNFATRYIELAKTTDEGGQMPTKDELVEMSDDDRGKALNAANEKITAILMKEAAAQDTPSLDTPDPKYIAGGLLNSLASAAASNLVSLTTDNSEFRYFTYSVPGAPNKAGEATNSTNQILLIFNFSDVIATVPEYEIKVPMRQIKVVVWNTALRAITYEWPPNEQSAEAAGLDLEKYQIGAFNEESLFEELVKNLATLVPSLGGDTAFDYVTETNTKFFTNQFPVIANLVFETILTQAPHHDLFIGPVFNKIPFTEEELKNSCVQGIGTTPLLNTDKLTADIDQTRQQLECLINVFETPDALQIANVYALQKLMIKVCIVEEYLKNIFIFGFLRMSDILEQDFYQPLFMKNLINTVDSAMGDGYATLLEYSAKIIHGRQYLGETFKNVTTAEVYESPLGPAEPMLPKEECLKILIREAAAEINEILDSRIQGIIDPAWTAKFTAYEDTADDAVERSTKARLLEYAILSTPDFWSPNIYPARSSAGFSDIEAFAQVSAGYDASQAKFPLSKMRDIAAPSSTTYAWTAKNTLQTTLDDTSHWPTKGVAAQPWSGGIFLQPYIKIHSKLESKKGDATTLDGPVESYYAKKAFWEKLKKAHSVKNNFWNSSYAAESKYDQEPFIDAKSPTDFIQTLKIKIEEESGHSPDMEVLTETFQLLWDLFDAGRIQESGDHLGDLPLESVPFTRLISSYVGTNLPGHDISYDTPYYYWSLPWVPGASPTGVADSPVGSPVSEKWHWLNRGTISTDLSFGVADRASKKRYTYVVNENARRIAAYVSAVKAYSYSKASWKGSDQGWTNHGSTAPNEPTLLRLPLEIDNLGNRNEAARDQVSWGHAADLRGSDMLFSTINAFGLCKEIPLQTHDNNEYGISPAHARWYTRVATLLKHLGWEGATGSGKTAGTDTSPAVDTWSWVQVRQFYNQLRDVIFDSAFDLWFDFTIGMRLNLLFPIPDEDLWIIDWSAYFAIVKGDDVNKYNEEKTFIWEKSPTERYLCLPMESTEHKYSDSAVISMSPESTKEIRTVTYPTEEEGGEYSIWRYVENELTIIESQTNPNIAHTGGGKKDSGFRNLGLAWTKESNLQDGGKATLWAISRAMEKAFIKHGDKILNSLKREVMVKAIGSPGATDIPNKFLGEILPINEVVTVTALMYRYYMEGAYPGLNNMFGSTKSSLRKYITQMIATINGDYQYVDALNKETSATEESEDDDEDVIIKFMKMVVQVMANLIDPTWKSPWFMPGPLTPVGILAKSLATKWSDDEEPNADPGEQKEPCGPPAGEEPQEPMG